MSFTIPLARLSLGQRRTKLGCPLVTPENFSKNFHGEHIDTGGRSPIPRFLVSGREEGDSTGAQGQAEAEVTDYSRWAAGRWGRRVRRLRSLTSGHRGKPQRRSGSAGTMAWFPVKTV